MVAFPFCYSRLPPGWFSLPVPKTLGSIKAALQISVFSTTQVGRSTFVIFASRVLSRHFSTASCLEPEAIFPSEWL